MLSLNKFHGQNEQDLKGQGWVQPVDTKPSVWEQEGKKKVRAWHHSLPHSAQALSGMGQPEALTANKSWERSLLPIHLHHPSALYQSPLLF